MRSTVWLRAGLVFYTVAEALIGVWAQLLPRSFYDEFPWPGHRWVALLPPYNEHLIRDFGGMNLAMAVVFGVAAVSLERRMVRAVLVGYLVFAVPHLLFHLNHLDPFRAVDAVSQTAALVIVAVLPLALLSLTVSRNARAAAGVGADKVVRAP